jgi:hypothetical protein
MTAAFQRLGASLRCRLDSPVRMPPDSNSACSTAGVTQTSVCWLGKHKSLEMTGFLVSNPHFGKRWGEMKRADDEPAP